MRPHGSQRNMRGGSNLTAQEILPMTKPGVERDSWQLKVLAIRGPRQDCWLMDNAKDVHVCNDLRLMTDLIEKPTNVRGSTADKISPGCGTVWIRLALEDRQKGVILNLQNVFYLPNSPSNLVSLSLLNDTNIFYNNERHILYDKTSRRSLAFAQCWERRFLLHPLNLSVLATNLLKVEDAYQKFEPKLRLTQSSKFPLTVWQKRFWHLNFSALRNHLTRHNIHYIKDERVCDSCKRAKATKHYNCTPQERAKRAYQFIYTDFIGPITPIGFDAERYFFTFTDNHTRITKTYTGR